MSMVATRMPLEAIGMNSVAGSPATRRSARLSADEQPEEESQRKKPRGGGPSVTATRSTTTKSQDASTTIEAGKRLKRKKEYDQESDGFVFTKSKRAKSTKEPTSRQDGGDGRNQLEDKTDARSRRDVSAKPAKSGVRNATHRVRKQLPTSPARRSPAKPAPQQQDEPPKSPFRAAHARSHANAHRSPSPHKPLTIEKKRRRHGEEEVESGRTARIVLPTSDTPIIRRNKSMRQSVVNGEKRRTSSGMRGRRVSSMMDEGKWNALPHSDVVASEFYTIISPDLTEPRRMRLLLGWCGDRALPPKAQAPISSSKQASEDFQASQAARVIQEELSKELSSNGALSEWFSRDIEEPPPKVILRKKPNPRNIANAAKAEELARELERLQLERKAWDQVTASADRLPSSSAHSKDDDHNGLSPLQPELLSSPQRAVYEQLNQPQNLAAVDPGQIQRRLQDISAKLEFSVDNFAHTVHAVSATRDLAEHIALRSTRDAVKELERREQESGGRKMSTFDALRGLARVLNARK